MIQMWNIYIFMNEVEYLNMYDSFENSFKSAFIYNRGDCLRKQMLHVPLLKRYCNVDSFVYGVCIVYLVI